MKIDKLVNKINHDICINGYGSDLHNKNEVEHILKEIAFKYKKEANLVEAFTIAQKERLGWEAEFWTEHIEYIKYLQEVYSRCL